MLQVAGLDADSELLYDKLLATPASVSQLVDATGLPAPRIRRAVRNLKALGLIRDEPDGTDGYAAIAPDIALDVLLLEREEELKRARARAQELSERFRQAAARRDPAELVEIVTGRQAIVQRTDQIIRSARSLIRCLDAPPYQDGGTTVNEAEMSFLARGGEVRTVYARDGLPSRLATIEGYLAAGEQGRVLPTVPTKLVLVDHRFAWVPLRSGTSLSPSFVIIHRSALLDALSGLFETLWRLAVPLDPGTAHPAEPDGLTAADRRLLGLLAAGLPDQAISRQIGVSYRTLQRRIHDLMNRLDVQTRFQLGVHAVRSGWLADPAPPRPAIPQPRTS